MFEFAFILLILFPAAAQAPRVLELPDDIRISRFSMVATGIYRGGQPDERGFSFLKEHGVKTIIDLRAEDEERADERAMVEKLGLKYFHVPIRLVFPWSKIPEAAISKYFEVINNPDNHPIFFHCRRGADRTGALAAAYRITNQGWRPERAWAEARATGLHWWYRGLKRQVHDFDRKEPASAGMGRDYSAPTSITGK